MVCEVPKQASNAPIQCGSVSIAVNYVYVYSDVQITGIGDSVIESRQYSAFSAAADVAPASRKINDDCVTGKSS
ncbi:MAG: hypothetical protein EZS28_039392 [Streblomastix strix]|uniref:Uncharacterized protein n=1 Tax=Streblomastix strix TaxID=222440 RepID=A0A5J4U548_9EUKA|nr:MAG: hypothetical protein EZS28_039392 [Streblomastix strix]